MQYSKLGFQVASRVASRLKILGNQEILEKSEIWVETKPSAQSPFKKLNFGNSSQKNMQKQISNFSFPVQFYWIFSTLVNIVSGIVGCASRFLNVAPAGIVNFSQFMEEIEYWDLGMLPSYSYFTKQLGNWDFFTCFYILSDCKDFLSGRVYVLGRQTNSHYVTILWHIKCWKHCLPA